MSEATVAAPGSRTGVDGPLVGAARTVESAARRAKDKVVAARDRIAEKSIGDIVEGGREMVRENPMKTVLVAAGVGALVGYMIARRRA